MKKALTISFAWFALFAMAGGPFERFGNGVPIIQDTTRPFVWNIDIDDLNFTYDNAAATALVRQQFNKWRDLPGTTLGIVEGDPLPINVTNNTEMIQMVNQGFSPIVLDQGNELLIEIGLGGGVIAAAGPRGVNDTGTARTQMVAIIGGASTNGRLEDDVATVLLHEFGHGLGLGHSVVNGEFFAFQIGYEDFGVPPEDDVEIMYWQAVASNTEPKIDDQSGYLALYGSSNTGAPGRGAIEGRVLLPDGVTGADGVNIVVRDVSGGANTAFTNAASTISFNTPNGSGYYRIPALPPGEYTVHVNDIADGNNGSYSDPLRSDTGSLGGNDIIGPFPGDEEFYNGPNESSSSATDDPTEFVTVTVTADQVTSGIDILFNRSEDDLGTLLPNVYNIPEVQTEGTQETRVGIVNSGDSTRNFDIFGFDATGNQVGQVVSLGTDIQPKQQIWFDVETAFGDAGEDVDWIQVGGSGQLLVFAEFGGPGTITAYWSSEGSSQNLFMPHVAKNTVGFETYLSAVNPTDQIVTGTATPQPDGIPVDLPELTTAFAQSFYNVIDLFGPDLSAVDWVQLEGTTLGNTGIAAMEYFVGLPDATRVASLGLTNQSGNTLRFVHVAADVNSFWTGLVYMNVGDSTANITESYYDAAGNVISTRDLTLDAGAKIDPLLLFDINNTEPAGTAWIEVAGDQPLVGYELFGSPFANDAVNYFAGLQGVYQGGANLYYPYVQSGDGSFTGIVALNIGELTSDITFTAYDSGGNILEEATIPEVGPKTKVTRLVNGLFSADTAADTAWVSASTTASSWAGFELWGGTDGQTLSGINAKATGVNAPPQEGTRQIVIEEEDNNTFETAQVLTMANGFWDINVVGFIDQNETNTPISATGDDIEDMYTFTLDEATPLVIAISPEISAADLDLYVTLGQQTITGARITALRNDPTVDWSAFIGGDESVAGVFPAGTYYVHVSSWDDPGNTVRETDYGLLITELPVYLETFDTDDWITDWAFSVLQADTDAQVSFNTSGGLNIDRFGRVLVNAISDGQGTEAAVAFTQFVDVPEEGLTILDLDSTYLFPIGPAPTRVDFGLTETTLSSTSVLLSNYNPSAFGGTNITFENVGLVTSGWVPWASFFEDRRDLTSIQSDPGTPVGLALATTHSTGQQLFDNIRMFNMLTTASGLSKRNGQVVLGRSGKSLMQKRRAAEVTRANPVHGNVTVEH